MLARCTHRALLLWATTSVLSFAPPSFEPLLAQQPKGVRPRWLEATLSNGPRSVKLLRVGEAIRSEHPIEGGAIRVDGGVVERLDESRAVLWRHDAGRFTKLRFLTEFDGDLILAESTLNLPGVSAPGEALRRLRLVDGEKIESLQVPEAQDRKKNTVGFLNALSIGDALFVLSRTLHQPQGEAWQTKTYRVDRYQKEWTWSRSFEAAPPSPGGRLIEDTRLTSDLAGLRSLSRMGDSLVVCAGPLEDIVCLDVVTGKTEWAIPRLWEYEKGYVGPSVFSHFIDRYGLHWFDKFRTQHEERSVPDSAAGRKKAEILQQRKERAENSPGSIIAGPVVLPVTGGEWPRYGVFVVTSQSADLRWADALAECVVYELDERGNCIGMAILPQFVDPARFTVLDGSVVWQCERSDWLRLFPSSRKDRTWGGGTGNPRNTIDYEWHPARIGRAGASREARSAWLRQGVYVPAVVVRGETMLSITEGGFIDREDSRVFRYPVMLTDFESGEARRLMLNLPFEGDVIPPEISGARPDDQLTADTPFLMTIEALTVRGRELIVEFHYGYNRSTLAFDLDNLLATE